MSYRPFRKISLCLLAACAVSFAVSSLSAQTATAPTVNPSRVDVFLGYSYFGAHGKVQPAGIAYTAVDEGAIGSGAYWFNKYVGGEVLGIANPDGVNDGFYGYYAGPIFRAPMQDFTLFAHGLAGGVQSSGPNNDENGNTPIFYNEPYQWGASLLVGGGMDYNLPWFHNHFGIRLFEADYRYMHFDYGPATTRTPVTSAGDLGGRANLDAIELSSGILFHFGSIIPPPPVSYACSITAPTGSIYPGDVVTVTGTATNLNPKKTPAYTWATDGGKVSGSSNVASIDTAGVAPGSYTAKGHVSEGSKPGELADCSAPFTVSPILPPTVGCSANPSTVNPGDPSTIMASGVSPQNRPLTYSYSASAGSVSGSTSTATLSTTGAAPGTISVTCNVVDDKGQTASSNTTVTVNAPPPPPAPTTSALCSVSFERDARRPARVDNEAKACLDDISLNLQRSSDAKLAVIGNASSTEKRGSKLAAERAVNTKEYLVKEKGVDASRISVYTGSQDGKTVTTTLIPAGATLDSTGITPVDESAAAAPPRTRKHHKQ